MFTVFKIKIGKIKTQEHTSFPLIIRVKTPITTESEE